MSNHIIIAVGKVHGGGRVQLPKEVRELLDIRDGDKVYFVQDDLGRIIIERAPKLERKLVGKYVVRR